MQHLEWNIKYYLNRLNIERCLEMLNKALKLPFALRSEWSSALERCFEMIRMRMDVIALEKCQLLEGEYRYMGSKSEFVGHLNRYD